MSMIRNRGNNFSMQFANGYVLSITIGEGSYSSTQWDRDRPQVNGEIAVLKDNKFVRIDGQHDDVIGWVSTGTIASVAYWLSLVDPSTGNLGAVRDAINKRSEKGVL